MYMSYVFIGRTPTGEEFVAVFDATKEGKVLCREPVIKVIEGLPYQDRLAAACELASAHCVARHSASQRWWPTHAPVLDEASRTTHHLIQ